MARYRKYSVYLKEKYGARVHRIPLQAGFYCPNRDGRLSRQGCIFCDVYGSGPLTFKPPPIREQLLEGMKRARRRYGAKFFIAYFQAFTNTYGPPEILRERYWQALEFPEIVEISIGTRPDCVPEPVVEVLEELAKERPLWVELGLESSHYRSLRWMRRNHGIADFIDAVLRLKERQGIKVAAHVILGIPGEGREEVVETARFLSALPVDGVKIHPLHVLKNTGLEKLYHEGKLSLLSMEDFVSLAVDFLENLRENMVVMRISGERSPQLFIAPGWALKKQKVLAEIDREMERRDSFQGKKLKLGLRAEECVPLKEPVKFST